MESKQNELIDYDSANCIAGFLNGILISLPIWAIVYFVFHNTFR